MKDRQCLREGLLLYRSLMMAGFEPTLHFGVKLLNGAATQNLEAHCWVKLAPDRVYNPPGPGMTEIFAARGNVAPVSNTLLDC